MTHDKRNRIQSLNRLVFPTWNSSNHKIRQQRLLETKVYVQCNHSWVWHAPLSGLNPTIPWTGTEPRGELQSSTALSTNGTMSNLESAVQNIKTTSCWFLDCYQWLLLLYFQKINMWTLLKIMDLVYIHLN